MQQWKGEKLSICSFRLFASLTILLAARLLSHDFSLLSPPSIPADNELKKGRRGGVKVFLMGNPLVKCSIGMVGEDLFFFLLPFVFWYQCPEPIHFPTQIQGQRRKGFFAFFVNFPLTVYVEHDPL